MKVNFDRWFNSADLPPGMLTAEHSAATHRDMFNVMKPEIFSEAQMTSYGTKLANAHQPFVGKSSFNLPERLAKNEQQLIRCAAILSEGDKKSLTPAGLWLLDNFYLIEEQIRLVRQLLPAKFGQGLPGLAGMVNGSCAASSITASRLDRISTASAALMPSRKAGRCSLRRASLSSV